ncbi:MAG: hypothetical protein AB1806_12580, partial [Acidobacteriota bacterium]
LHATVYGPVPPAAVGATHVTVAGWLLCEVPDGEGGHVSVRSGTGGGVGAGVGVGVGAVGELPPHDDNAIAHTSHTAG